MSIRHFNERVIDSTFFFLPGATWPLCVHLFVCAWKKKKEKVRPSYKFVWTNITPSHPTMSVDGNYVRSLWSCCPSGRRRRGKEGR